MVTPLITLPSGHTGSPLFHMFGSNTPFVPFGQGSTLQFMSQAVSANGAVEGVNNQLRGGSAVPVRADETARENAAPVKAQQFNPFRRENFFYQPGGQSSFLAQLFSQESKPGSDNMFSRLFTSNSTSLTRGRAANLGFSPAISRAGLSFSGMGQTARALELYGVSSFANTSQPFSVGHSGFSAYNATLSRNNAFLMAYSFAARGIAS